MTREQARAAAPERSLVDDVVRLTGAVQAVLRARRAEATPADLTAAEGMLQSTFEHLWSRTQHVDLGVAEEAITFDGTPVLARAQDSGGLIAALRAAGIHGIGLDPGVELEEIKVVLSAVVASRGDREQGTNLLTSLFRADLVHFSYQVDLVADGPVAKSSGPSSARIAAGERPPAASPETVRRTLREDAAEPADSGIVRLEKFDSTLYFLDEREIDYLKSAIDREYAQDLALNTLTLLLDILESRPQPAVREEVIGILADLLPVLLSEGRFEAVASLVAGVREASRDAVELAADDKGALDTLRSSVSTTEALSQLFHALERGAVAPTARSTDILLRELRPSAIREILTWPTRLSDPSTRTAVSEALDSFFTEWPHGLSRMLTATQTDVVQAGLELAGRLKLPEFADLVAEIATHDDARVRRLVAQALAGIGTAPALRNLLGMVDDRDRDVRVMVYRAFSARPSRGAFATFRRTVTETDLEARGDREKRALFEAFGAVAGPEGVEILEPLLRGRGSLGRGASSHSRACAAIALGMIGTPQARAALEGSSNDRDPVVRSAVAAALRGETRA